MSAPCPFCGFDGGFHDEVVHARIPIPAELTWPSNNSTRAAMRAVYRELVPAAKDGHRSGNAADVPGHPNG